MTDISQKWNDVSKKKKKYQSSKKNNKEKVNNDINFYTNVNFPSLLSKVKANNINSTKNTYEPLSWKKQIFPKISNNIYDSAMEGMLILNDYPIFSESPSFPSFN